jgi:hypothetical protein
VFNRFDVVFMLGAIVAMPYLYLVLPVSVAAGFLGLGMLSILMVSLQPVVARWARWAVVPTLLGLDVGLAIAQGAGSPAFLAVNDLVLLIVVVGTAALWAQSGMKASNLGLLAAGITVYDILATSQASVMARIATRLSAIPFVPFVGWGPRGGGLAIGLGDLLVAAVFPLVMRKAFGRTAGRVALVTGLVTLGGMLTVVSAIRTEPVVPAMLFLGPVMLVQMAWWRRRLRAERTTWQYLAAEPLAAARSNA